MFAAFLLALSGKYINNIYHNYKHGVDVCFTSYRLLYVPGLNTALSLLEVFSVLVGAIAHDVGHPGVNNAFLIKTTHSLALQHNDRSPLENMHCVTLYEILAKAECNVFHTLDRKQKNESRAIILTIILGTDMVHHFEQIQKTQVSPMLMLLCLCVDGWVLCWMGCLRQPFGSVLLWVAVALRGAGWRVSPATRLAFLASCWCVGAGGGTKAEQLSNWDMNGSG